MDTDQDLRDSALRGALSHVLCLILEGGANVNGADRGGYTALHIAAKSCANVYNDVDSTTVQWLVEHGGADLTQASVITGETVWDRLAIFLRKFRYRPDEPNIYIVSEQARLEPLRAMVLRDAPPRDYLEGMDEVK
jgi:ankyrin repeat protein